MFRLDLIRGKLIKLALTMFVAILFTAGSGGYIIYQTSISETAQRLTETAKSNARMIEEVAYFDKAHSKEMHSGASSFDATLSQVKAAHEQIRFGQSGEFTLAKKQGKQIVFLMRNYLAGMDIPNPVSLDRTDRAEPMRRALSGKSGWMIGNDYRGVHVMAAYEPVDILNLGIVAKLDMQEIRAPFIKAGMVIIAFAILISLFALRIFYQTSRQISDKFEDSNRQFSRLASNAKDVIYRMSIPDGRYEYINPASSELFGITPQAFYNTPKKIQELIHPNWHAYFDEQWQKLLNGDMPPTYEFQIVTPSGETKWIVQRNVLVTDDSGRPVAIEGIASDITERKQAEQALAKSEERFSLAMQGANDGLWDWDMQTNVITYSVRWKSMLGYAENELENKFATWERLVHPDDIKRAKQVIDDYLTGKVPKFELEHRMLHKDGHWVDILARGFAIRNESNGTYVRFVGTHVDITKRKQTEQALHQSEEHFRELFTGNKSVELIIDPDDGRIIEANRAAEKFYGYSQEQLLNLSISDINTLSKEQIGREMARAKLEKSDHFIFRHRLADGDIRDVEVYSGPIHWNQKQVLYSIVHDISDRKRVEVAKDKAEKHAKGVIENARDGFVAIDREGIVIDWNPEAERMFGFSSEEVIGQLLSDTIIPLAQRKAHIEGMKHYLATGEGRLIDKHIEITALHKNGILIPVELTIIPLALGDTVTFNAFIRNLTEINKAKDKILQNISTIRKGLKGTIDVVSKIVEARDPYTAGHQHRVSQLSRAIAQKMGLDDETVEGIRIGATIHDIGKVQIPSEILSKPGKLSQLEYKLIQSHPGAGYHILKDIEFPWPIAEIAYQHHERIDGSGYPQRLKGDEICLAARIVCVADVVEAMSNHRPYRASLGIDVALEAIQVHRGTMFDEAVVDACLLLFSEKKFSF
ncbi:PAS domain S-box protein [Candidatus Venteria ishoeyi]|uniref:PAS domain S-box protein n=1 Tax=Candidatus Venteria ishoeyi TaxID=1899563 RepID=UPI0025A57672|nr:PAS domain S-box protein [Candidatus Venteria ishoeyi]MDM8545601.1 PAS domain S-box protein [Candidatus Venteria ishoeyi]